MNGAMRIIDYLAMKDPETTVQIIVIYGLDALASEFGLKRVHESREIENLMRHDRYSRHNGAVRQVGRR